MRLKFVSTILILMVLQGLVYTQNESIPVGKQPVRVGFPLYFFKDIDIRDAKAAVEVWANNLVVLKSTDMYLKTILYSDLHSMENAFAQGNVDLLLLPVLDFLKIRNNYPIEPILIGNPGKDYGDNYLLTVNKDKGITGLAELRGKELTIHPDGSEELINLWLKVLLNKNKLQSPELFFSNIKYVNKATQAVLPVFFNQNDVCVVKKSALETINSLNPQIERNIQIISESPRFIREVFCINKNVKAEYRELIQKIVLSINDDPAGRQILLFFKSPNILLYKQEYLNSINVLLDDYNKVQSSEK